MKNAFLPKQVGPRELRSLLEVLLDGEWSPDKPGIMLWGPPGVGKSSVVRQLCEDRGWGFVDIRLTLVQGIDLIGLPYTETLQGEKITRYARSVFLPGNKALAPSAGPDDPAGLRNGAVLLPRDGCGNWVIMLDELASALPSVQVQAYQMLTEHRIGPHELPPGVHVVAAGNRMTDRAATYRMPSPLVNRLLHLEVRADLEQWLDYMLPRGLRADIAAYLRYNEKRLLDEDAISDTLPFPTPRSWTYLNWALNRLEEAGLSADSGEAKIVASGIIGPAAASDWYAYRQAFHRIPDTRAIMEGRGDPPPPGEPDALFATVSSLVSLVPKYPDLTHFLRWLKKLPASYAVLAVRDAIRTGAEVRDRIVDNPAWLELFNLYKAEICVVIQADKHDRRR